jgi:uncharacterized 2Fe-2S/4Fe-4S cluster protein (DUF4445 family)
MAEARDKARVTFDSGETAEVRPGSVLLAAALVVHYPVDAPCGGRGTCGKCRVRAEGQLSPASADERLLLGDGSIAAGLRLACRARVLGDVAVSTPATTPTATQPAILETASVRAPYEVEPPQDRGVATTESSVGLALDVGTTTLVACLVDLHSGDRLAVTSALNPQARFGADVMSRIAASGDHGPELHEELAGALNELTGRLLSRFGLTGDDVAEVAATGNTVMMHLLAGADPRALGTAPYAAEFLGGTTVPAASLGLRTAVGAGVYLLPGVSAFIGADVTADLLATGLAGQEGPSVLVDLGTNGEIVLRTPGRLVATSAAAGPAFEGAGIECGMRAADGAIEHASLERGDLAFSTIGGGPPRGICGSGLIDLVALLLDSGVIDAEGALVTGLPGPLGARVQDRADQRIVAIDEPSGTVLTQKDVRELQLAKGAVAVAIAVLFEETAVDPSDVAEVLLAGGFGRSVRSASLARIGILPAALVSRVRFVGNTALEGARAALVSSLAREGAQALASSIEAIPLSGDERFRTRFMAALSFPPA